uniref:butyrophilin subfamily 3 member A2-like isoform X2 n=1 Tax=Gasterosteus aculeatus aculeatus TaxID=481459 RepID=UPI001A99EAC4|nr:butyrophilin subfamily 3 member A2-like isoform X2 [Gasterosteus aculeatus aculeatus]
MDSNDLNRLPGGSLPIDPPQLVTAMVGDDVVLPCLLDPPADAVSMTMEWGRADMKPRFVLVWHDGKELLTGQNEAFKGRTSLSISGLKRGDVSLKLSSVKVSDSGTYRCYLQKPNQEHLVQLLVGAASSPAISLAGLHLTSSAVLLHCESRGWYPEPELLWLDAEGKLLSAGPPETLRGPDDLYSVSRSVTVEKRHRNSFTCRVQQRNINQTRETLITVPADLFKVETSSAVRLTIFSAVCIVGVVAVVLVVWRCGKEETKTTSSRPEPELQPLTEGGRDTEKNMTCSEETFEEDLKENSAELELLQHVVKTLMDQKKDLRKQREVLISQQHENQTQIQEFKKKKKKKCKLENLEKRENEHMKLLQSTQELQDSTEEMIIKMTERTGRILRDQEKIRSKLQKTERKTEEIQSPLESQREEEETSKTSV